MYCIGLTGPLGSGKSTVARMFAELGVHVISADLVAREITAPGQPALQQIVTRFGQEILDDFAQLNRSKLRQLIFADPSLRQWVEQLLHPLIRTRLTELSQDKAYPYCIIEIPLLFKRTDYPFIQEILVVQAPLNQQIERVIERDQASREEILSILDAQPSVDEYLAMADDIIENNGSISKLKEQVLQIHQIFISK